MAIISLATIRAGATARARQFVEQSGISSSDFDECIAQAFLRLYPHIYKVTKSTVAVTNGMITVTDNAAVLSVKGKSTHTGNVLHDFPMMTVGDTELELTDPDATWLAEVDVYTVTPHVAPTGVGTVVFPDQFLDLLYDRVLLELLTKRFLDISEFQGFRPNEPESGVDAYQMGRLFDLVEDRYQQMLDEKRMARHAVRI